MPPPPRGMQKTIYIVLLLQSVLVQPIAVVIYCLCSAGHFNLPQSLLIPFSYVLMVWPVVSAIAFVVLLNRFTTLNFVLMWAVCVVFATIQYGASFMLSIVILGFYI